MESQALRAAGCRARPRAGSASSAEAIAIRRRRKQVISRRAAAGPRPDHARRRNQAFIAGFNTILLVAVAIAVVGAVSALVLVRQRDFVAAGAPESVPAGA